MTKPIGILLAAICVWCALSGCVKLYVYYPVDVRVTDAETGKAIGNAEVGVGYAWKFVANPPKAEKSVTDADGRARVWAATVGQFWTVKAKGYLPASLSRWPGENWKPEDGVLKLTAYQEPEAKITIVVANDYRGPLIVEMLPAEGRGLTGKRDYLFAPNVHGYVGIVQTDLVTEKTKLRVERENGEQLLTQPSTNFAAADTRSEVGLREVCACVDSVRIMAVGTWEDFEKVKVLAEKNKKAAEMMVKEARER